LVRIRIICPVCHKSSYIDVLVDVIKGVSRGLLSVNISPGLVCSHNFIAYIDKNLNVRDYFATDFQIELPKLINEKKFEINKIPKKEIIDLDLIKLNMPAMQLTYILKSIFLKQKILLIYDEEFMHPHFHNFFKFLTENSFEINIIIMTKQKYEHEKKNYIDSMVFKETSMLKNVKKLINPKKLSIEKQIVNRFITENDLNYGYILLKNEIIKAYELSKDIVDFINDLKERNEIINVLKIKTKLEQKYEIKINTFYLAFLIEIVSNYHEIALPSFAESFYDFL